MTCSITRYHFCEAACEKFTPFAQDHLGPVFFGKFDLHKGTGFFCHGAGPAFDLLPQCTRPG